MLSFLNSRERVCVDECRFALESVLENGEVETVHGGGDGGDELGT